MSRFRLHCSVVRHCAPLVLTMYALGAVAATPTLPTLSEPDARISAMKHHPRGPFARIRWFCKDGTVLPPEPSACAERGGGHQHGEWSETTLALRAAGYRIANVYADLDVAALLGGDDPAAALAQMAVERFLLQVDDGWILRRARYYRGAFQEEGERAGARRLLLALAAQPRWHDAHYLLWRSLAALLPHGADGASARAVRQAASNLAELDSSFLDLKNKIHVQPAPGDAAAVRAHAARLDDPALAADFARLADGIDALYALDTGRVLSDLAARVEAAAPTLAATLRAHGGTLGPQAAPRERYAASATLLAAFRAALPGLGDAALRLAVLDAGRQVEAEHYVAGSALTETLADMSRAARLGLLADATAALYGTGLLSARQRDALADTFAGLAVAEAGLPDYRAAIDYLGLVPGWGDRHMQFNFAPGVARLAELEPLARLFTQDQLRGSPLFHFAAIVDTLQRDANRLAGVAHRLFERDAGGGLRALNPGLARGILRDGRDLAVEEFSADGIYLLPETVADLPPVAGILTAGEGNPLSHVQLLARNLGIPNVAVATALLDTLAAHEGEAVVLAVSSGGSVHLRTETPELAAALAGDQQQAAPVIEPDLAKLDLTQRAPLALGALRAEDSGRSVGPKAAKLGELKAHYPDAVADGVAIPFGVFRAVLERPAAQGSGSLFDWIVAGYRHLETLPAGSDERAAATDALRQAIYDAVAASTLPPALAAELRVLLEARLGADGSFGVFVRSDTNVEDLPGFTGAGLNLTLPNVVGFDNILAAIPRVWASPFTARAFAWRQALMPQPEHVYPAVLLLASVDADKSGVLVTQDIDSGDRGWLSVAVNEGVGGAVDGQSAESLRIHLDSGRVRLMAQASAPYRRQVDPAGGIMSLPASGADAVLQPDEIARLVVFARELPERFPPIVDADGRPAPADIEFGFEDGALRLFQIRPFLDNAAARANRYLVEMDPDPATLADIRVALDGVPD
ncbi:MAG: PEP/pyruvate-binding domain-containing protein [Gammaproteobacteria bacterium]